MVGGRLGTLAHSPRGGIVRSDCRSPDGMVRTMRGGSGNIRRKSLGEERSITTRPLHSLDSRGQAAILNADICGL